MTAQITPLFKIAGVFAMLLVGCSSENNENPSDATGGASGTPATGGSTTGGTAGASGSSTGGAGGTMVVPTPEGTLFMDDFEGGATKWDVTQGSCSIQADDGTNVYTCINDMLSEARAVAGDIWGEYTLKARIRVNSMDPVGGRRIHLAGRFTDSNNWYGAAIYDGSPFEVQIRKKVMGTSSEVARTTYPIVFGTWYTLKLEMKGNTLSLYVDDVLQLTATDTQFSSGKLALLVDRSDVSWDDVLVTNP